MSFIRYVFCKFLSQFMSYIFIFVTVFFIQQKFVIVMKSKLPALFMDCTFGIRSKKPSSNPRSPSFFSHVIS